MIRIISFWVIVMMVSFNAFTSSEAFEDGYIWEYDQRFISKDGEESPLGGLKYHLTETALRIDDDKESVVVDYETGTLTRCNNLEKACDVFYLKNQDQGNPVAPDQNLQVKEKMIDVLGSIHVEPENETKIINNISCRKINVLFGSQMTRFRMMAPVVIDKYGRQFTEYSATYWVSKKIVGYEKLIKIGEKRSLYFKANPLVRQIDITGLLQILDGFPVFIDQPLKDGRKMKSTLKFIKMKKMKKSVFTMPAGYQKKIHNQPS